MDDWNLWGMHLFHFFYKELVFSPATFRGLIYFFSVMRFFFLWHAPISWLPVEEQGWRLQKKKTSTLQDGLWHFSIPALLPFSPVKDLVQFCAETVPHRKLCTSKPLHLSLCALIPLLQRFCLTFWIKIPKKKKKNFSIPKPAIKLFSNNATRKMKTTLLFFLGFFLLLLEVSWLEGNITLWESVFLHVLSVDDWPWTEKESS